MMGESGRERGSGCGISRNAACQWSTLLKLLLVVLLGNMVQDADAIHATGQCVQLGQAHASVREFHMDDQKRMGPWTIGTRKFDTRYTYLDLSTYKTQTFSQQNEHTRTCPYKVDIGPYECAQNINYCGQMVNPCPGDEEIELRTYAVKQDGKVMHGWLHFEFELKIPNDEIYAVYVQVRDEYFNAIGEFVSNPKEQCTPSKDYLVQPTEYQILPCSAIGLREAKLANAVFMAESHVYKNPQLVAKYIPKKSISRGIHFTWRLSEYWCNRHYYFRPEAIILTRKNTERSGGHRGGRYKYPLIYRKAAKYWIYPGWFGTADIKLPHTELSCNEKVIDYSNGKVDQNLGPWLHPNGRLAVLGDDYFSRKLLFVDYGGVESIRSCQWSIRRTNEPENAKNPFGKDIAPTFAGRCTHHFEKTPGHEVLPGCNLDGSAPEFADVKPLNFPPYSKYVQTLTTNRTNLCSVPCRIPTVENITDIRKFTDRTDEYQWIKKVQYNSDSRNKSRIEKLIVGKKYHAMLCIVWTMFLTPLGIFSARYFKETCMNFTCVGAHFWFWIHGATTVAAAAAFISSLTGIWSNLENWGRNVDPAGKAHRIVGYTSVVVFFLMIMLGGLRPLERRKRLIMMTLHSLLGFLIYFLNVAAMVLSFFIPASPTIGKCDEMGYSTEMSKAIFPIGIWVVIDILLHIAMTILQLVKDRSVGLRRPWYFPIIPILPHDSANDFVGSSLRKITLIVYAGAAFIMTSTTIGLIFGEGIPPFECRERTGMLSCNATWGCSATAKAFAAKILGSKPESGRYVGDFIADNIQE